MEIEFKIFHFKLMLISRYYAKIITNIIKLEK